MEVVQAGKRLPIDTFIWCRRGAGNSFHIQDVLAFEHTQQAGFIQFPGQMLQMEIAARGRVRPER